MGKRKYVIGRKKKQYDHRINLVSKKLKLSQANNLLNPLTQTTHVDQENAAIVDNTSTETGEIFFESQQDIGGYENQIEEFDVSETAFYESYEPKNKKPKYIEGTSFEENEYLLSDGCDAGVQNEDIGENRELEMVNNFYGTDPTKSDNDIEITCEFKEGSIDAVNCEQQTVNYFYEKHSTKTANDIDLSSVIYTTPELQIGDVIEWQSIEVDEYTEMKEDDTTAFSEYIENARENSSVGAECAENMLNENWNCENSDEINEDCVEDSQYDWDDLFINSDDDCEEYSEDTPIDNKNDSKCRQTQGNRIVNLWFIINQIKEMNSHSKTCNFNDMDLVNGHEEFKKGFNSSLKFICSKCSFISTLKCSDEDDFMDINYAAVVAAFAIGIGHSQLEEFTAVLGIPSMAHSTFEVYQKKVLLDLDGATRQSMDNAAKDEIKYAIQKGNVDSKERPFSKAFIDGAWNKRSYRTNYSASSGTTTLIGYNTKKVIWNDVANKYCVICARILAKKLEPYEHNCNINYKGSSTGMEAKLAVKGLKECEERYNLRIEEIIGDGDSSVISELNKAQIYKFPILKIRKIDCCNHIFRNVRGSLRKIAKSKKLQPYITNRKIEEIVQGIRSARMHWVKTDLPKSGQIENLRQDILNAPSHVFGSHEKCADYFCTKKDEKDPNFVQIMKEDKTFDSVQNALSRARLNVRSILIYENTNIVEHFNSLIVKHSGNKRVNFSKSGSWKGRVQFAVLDFNTKRAYSTLCEFVNKKPQPLMEKLEFKRMSKNLHELVKVHKYVSKHFGESGSDGSYGNKCEKPDLDDTEFDLEKKLFLEFIRENYVKGQQIIRIDNENYTELDSIRSTLLTSSNFGTVCTARSSASYPGIVNEILYEESMTLKEIVHQSTYKSHAIRKLEDQEHIKVNLGALFINRNAHTLAATPDGLVGEDSIVVIKCPLATFGVDIKVSILEGKLPIWKKERKRKNNPNFVPKITGLNKNHKWYYEIQGQLHITQRNWCYLAVWVGDDLQLGVEKIEKDDSFWKDKMESKLKLFYDKVLLPELVDSRSSRYMELRKFDKDYICIG